jgi:basic amino acid/polyamine antiporter, APA family
MTTPDTVEDQPQLRRVMGPGLLLLFVVGDILGTSVYALIGDVAAEVGGAAWLPFLVAFLIATVTAFSYLELVTKYPQAAGAALYAHKAFGVQFVTFLVAFVVMCSGITSASTASRFFAANFNTAFDLDWGKVGTVIVALLFMAMLATVNLRGVGESVKLNVALTIIEITGLVTVILVGLWAFTGSADVDFSRVVAFETAADKNAFLAVTTATSLAFFAMVGFEDSVNMAEETKDPVRVFPKVLLSGMTIAGVVYVIVSIVAVALVPIGTLEASDTPLVEVVKAGAPGLPIVFTTLIAFGLIFYVTAFANSDAIAVLGGTTSLLLLAVFAVVNVAVLVLRRDVREAGGQFRTPTALPVIGCLASLYLVTPLSGRPAQQYVLALILVAIGILLFFLTWVINRQLGIRGAGITDPTHLGSAPD